MSEEMKMSLLALGNARETVEIEGLDGQSITVTIKPLTWEQEYRISAVIEEKIKRGIPQNVADRDYMLLTVQSGIVEPKFTEHELMMLKVGVVTEISRRIASLSGTSQKK